MPHGGFTLKDMRTKNLISISTLPLLPILSCVAGALSQPAYAKGAVLAEINGTAITLEDFNNKYRENLKFFPTNAPSKKAVLDDLVKRELAIQAAKKQGLDKDPVVIERMNTVLFQALVEKQLSKEVEKIEVSDNEAKDYYSKNPEIRTSHIFVALRPDAGPDQEAAARKRLASIQEELKTGASFAELAQNKSEGPAAPMGGDIDYKTRNNLDAAYYNAALALGKPGKISGIVKTPFGLHLIKLTAIRSWDDTDQGQVKRQIFDEKRNALFEKLMSKLRQEGKITIHSALLKD
ncbi:MAG: hypothetical protein RJB38_1966 [Pseudomonadota bacterium]|jgi:peptidyl-prolyl cis-trans isomerase C/peptidyl-prolyl cis-trans isomerase D